MSRIKVRILAVFVIILPLIADQTIKYYVKNGLFKPFFWLESLKFHQNYGFIGGLPAPKWLIIPLMLIFTLILAYFWVDVILRASVPTKSGQAPQESSTLILGLSLMLSGALSNLADRLIFGYILDYFQIGTAIFNLGDAVIVLGLIIILTLDINHKTCNN